LLWRKIGQSFIKLQSHEIWWFTFLLTTLYVSHTEVHANDHDLPERGVYASPVTTHLVRLPNTSLEELGKQTGLT